MLSPPALPGGACETEREGWLASSGSRYRDRVGEEEEGGRCEQRGLSGELGAGTGACQGSGPFA